MLIALDTCHMQGKENGIDIRDSPTLEVSSTFRLASTGSCSLAGTDNHYLASGKGCPYAGSERYLYRREVICTYLEDP